MSPIPSTSVRLHGEFVRLLFLQTHWETDRFFATSGVQLEQTDRVQFHFLRAAFSQQLKGKVGLALAKAEALCINLNLDVRVTITSKSHTHPSHSQTRVPGLEMPWNPGTNLALGPNDSNLF